MYERDNSRMLVLFCFTFYFPDAVTAQVKADIVLREVTRNGLHVDYIPALRLKKQLEEEMEGVMREIEDLQDYNPFSTWKAGPHKGELKKTKNRKPMMKQEVDPSPVLHSLSLAYLVVSRLFRFLGLLSVSFVSLDPMFSFSLQMEREENTEWRESTAP